MLGRQVGKQVVAEIPRQASCATAVLPCTAAAAGLGSRAHARQRLCDGHGQVEVHQLDGQGGQRSLQGDSSGERGMLDLHVSVSGSIG